MESIDIATLQEWKIAGEEFFLLDVREYFEHDHKNIGGLNIPLGELIAKKHLLPQDKKIVCYCAKGIRSAIAIQKLEQKGWTMLYNLAGGIGH